MKHVELFKNLEDCTGCGVCSIVCPLNAISMKEGFGGSLYPVINNDKCVECMKCVRFCERKKNSSTHEAMETYLAQTQLGDLEQSSSGGVYTCLAKSILDHGGAVSGVKLLKKESGFECKQHIIDDKLELDKCKGSKYVQSDMIELASEISEILNNTDRKVFFCGTPCQVAAIKALCEDNTNHFYTADLVCHGVPSIALFNKYIDELELRKSSNITDFEFRNKQNGWRLMAKAYYSNRKDGDYFELIEPEQSSYYKEFLDGTIYRHSCYTCRFADKKRVGDITLGDYWNIDLADPAAYHSMLNKTGKAHGFSVLAINTEKGKELIKEFGQNLALVSSEYDRAAKYNSQMVRPSSGKIMKAEKMLMNYHKYDRINHWKYLVFISKNLVRKKIPQPVKRAVRSLIKK